MGNARKLNGHRADKQLPQDAYLGQKEGQMRTQSQIAIGNLTHVPAVDATSPG